MLFSAAMLFFIKSKCITFIAQKTGINHWFEFKNPINTADRYKKLFRAFKRETVQFLVAKTPCRKSLTAGSPSGRSNVNCKPQTLPQDRGHVTFCGLCFSMKNLRLRVSNLSNKVYGKRQSSDSSWQFLKFGNEKRKNKRNKCLLSVFVSDKDIAKLYVQFFRPK